MSVFISVVLEHGEIPEAICSGPGIAKSKDFYVETDYEAELAAIWEDKDIGPEEIEKAASWIGTSGPWFDPYVGLKTVTGLIAHVESLTANEHDARQVTLREGWLMS